jgi:hypothetical protein
MPVDQAEERRRNKKALAIVAVVLIALAAFAYRPATVIGVDGDALAHSVGGGNVLGASDCVKLSGDHWRCRIIFGSDGATYAVQTQAFGCWQAVERGVTGEHGVKVADSGCINALDVVSPF